MAKQIVNNPFFTGKTDIPYEFFCDRKKETALLIKKIANGSNIVLKAPRRTGKSSLIKHLFKQKEVASNYNTLYVDVYGTKTMDGFIEEFQSAFFSAPFARTEAGKKRITELFKGLLISANTDPAGNLVGFSFGLNQPQQVSLTLKEMFAFLEKTSKPNIVVFDEFQQINDYPERAAAIIRTFVQNLNNTLFIFSGSSQHLLDNMFEYPNQPFYRSAASMTLGPIEMNAYSDFCQEMFEKYGKSIDEETVQFVYQLFSANTYDMQEVMKETFPEIVKDSKATKEDVYAAIDRLLDSRDEEFRSILNKIENEKNRKVLYFVLREGLASGLTSGATMRQYGLDNASSVQNALNVLCGDNVNAVVKVGKNQYQARDRFFELWFARKEGNLENKFLHVEERYSKEMKLRTEVKIV